MKTDDKKPRRRAATAKAVELLAGERIAEIEQVSGKTLIVADPQRVVAEAEALAFSDVTHVLVCTTIEELKALPESVRHAIKSVEQVETRTGAAKWDEEQKAFVYPCVTRRLKITMHDKIEMLKLLALITQAVKDPAKTGDDTPAFTGFQVVLGQPKAKNFQ